MKKKTLIQKSVGDSVNETLLTDEIISLLYSEEVPNHIFRFPFGIDANDAFGASESVFERATGEYKLVVTTQRLLISNEIDHGIRTEAIPLSNVREFSFSTPGLLSVGNIKIRTDDGEISGKIHKNTTEEELQAAKRYVQNTNTQPHDSPSSDASGFGDVTDRAVVEDVTIVESYGYHIDDQAYNLEITSEGIKLRNKSLLGDRQLYEISKEDIFFDEISTTEKRNISSENIGRYINQINPLLDDAAPAKKKNKSLIKIPLYDGDGHITFQTKNKSDIKIILNSMSKLDPRMQTSSGNADQTNSDGGPMEILKRRLAKGEISPEEFEERKEYLD